MSWRRTELSGLIESRAWLSKSDACRVYASALHRTSKSRYGLDEDQCDITASWDVDDVSDEETREKLATLLGDGEFFVVFSQEDVLRVSSAVFISRWRDMFTPSRDDVVMISSSEEWCLFYCHEDEFEFVKIRA